MTSNITKHTKNKCSKCKQNLTKNEFMSCLRCKMSFDLICANVSVQRFYSTLTTEKKKAWRCDSCIQRDRKELTVKNTNTASPSSSHQYLTPESKLLITKAVSTEESNNVTQRDKNNINIQAEISFEAASTDLEEEDTVLSTNEHNNNRSCPDLRRINDLEKIEDLERLINELNEKLSSADQEIIKLLSENSSLKEVVCKQNQKIAQLTQICGSTKKTPQNIKKSRKKCKRVENSSIEEQSTITAMTNSVPDSDEQEEINSDDKQEKHETKQYTLTKTNSSCDKYKIKILGDEHLLGLSAELIKTRSGKWNDKYHPMAHIASEASSTQILDSCNDGFLKNLSENDIVVICVGAHDRHIVKMESELHIALNKLKHVKVYVVPIYFSKYLNVKLLNYRLKLCTKIYPKCMFLDLDLYNCKNKIDFLSSLCNKLNVNIDHDVYTSTFLDPKKIVMYSRNKTINRTLRHSKENSKRQFHQRNMRDYFPVVKKTLHVIPDVENNRDVFFRADL